MYVLNCGVYELKITKMCINFKYLLAIIVFEKIIAGRNLQGRQFDMPALHNQLQFVIKKIQNRIPIEKK